MAALAREHNATAVPYSAAFPKCLAIKTTSQVEECTQAIENENCQGRAYFGILIGANAPPLAIVGGYLRVVCRASGLAQANTATEP